MSNQRGLDWANSQWWHIYPLGALGADTTGQDLTCHRPFSDLIPWLDHVRDLGLNGIALGPIFRSELHGYDTIDHFEIDPRLGTPTDFQAFLDAAKERGMVVMLDGVFNHVSCNHPLVKDIDQAATAGWVNTDAEGKPQVFEGHGQLVQLNHSNPAVVDLIVETMCYWLQRGVNGWRLDAAYAVAPQVWKQVIDRVRESFPHALICGEVIHGDYPAFVRDSGVDTVTQYELWKAIWSSLKDANMHELAWTLKRHNMFLQTFLPWTFISNHDVTRIQSQVSAHHAEIAAVIWATLPGIPAVYYGDELGWTGVKEERFGGDDAIRPELPTQPPAPQERPDIYRLYQHLLGLRRRIPGICTGQVRTFTVNGPVIGFSVHEAAATQTATPTETQAIGCTAQATKIDENNVDELPVGKPLIAVVVNAGKTETRMQVPGGKQILAGIRYQASTDTGEQLTLQAGGWAIVAQ